MKTEKSILCGSRIKEIRLYLGLTQEAFGKKLGEWGIHDKSGNPGRSAEIIASWESGRNQVPPSVLRAIMDNVKYEGEKISWAYLNGESRYITLEPNGVIRTAKQIIQNFNTGDFPKTKSNFSLDAPDKWENILYNQLLPYFGYSYKKIKDITRFYYFSQTEIKKIIDEYINKEERGE